MAQHMERRNEEEKKRRERRLKNLQDSVEWTVLVYLAGDSNLTPNCITVLQQLEAEVEEKHNIRVLACFDSNTPWPKGSRYLAINGKQFKNHENLDWEIYNDLIITEERGHEIQAPDFCDTVDSCNDDKSDNDEQPKREHMKRTDVAEGLRRFLKWARKQGHSQHYMLVLYGHGPIVGGKTFLGRENPASSLGMAELSKLLKGHFGGRRRKLDILAFQNCAMSSIEMAYELKDHVNYMIGSQGLVLAYGWPYDKIIKFLVNNLDKDPLEISRQILKICARHLIDFTVMDRSSEQAVCDLSKLNGGETLTDAIRDFSTELHGALQFKDESDPKELKYPIICDTVRLARLEAQSYWGETFVDVYDFCERLLKKCNEAVKVQTDLMSSLATTLRANGDLNAPDVEARIRETDLLKRLKTIIEHCNTVKERVEEMVPHSYYIGAELQYSHGLSIYFPWSLPAEPYTFIQEGYDHVLVTAFETYSGYCFVAESKWADCFLRSFYRATLRRVRRADRDFLMRPAADPLSEGLVTERYKARTEVLTTEYLQKTDSDSGSGDPEVWSNVKNYPRRNYLSPSDCPRRANRPRRGRGAGDRDDPQPFVSYLGWNLCEFVYDVIKKKDNGNNGGGKTQTSSQKEVVSEPTEPESGRADNRRP